MDLVPDPTLPEKFLWYSRKSNPGPLGWQSDVLTTIPNRRSYIYIYNQNILPKGRSFIEKIPGPPLVEVRRVDSLTGPSGLQRNSPQGLNISSISVFDQIRYPKSQLPFAPVYCAANLAPSWFARGSYDIYLTTSFKYQVTYRITENTKF